MRARIQKSLLLFSGTLLFLTPAIFGGEFPPDDEMNAPPAVWREVQLALRILGTTEKSVTAVLGEPGRSSQESLPNRHDATVTDAILTLEYPGVRVEIYKALLGTPHQKELLARVVLSNDHSMFPTAVQIGTSRHSVVEALGTPVDSSEKALWYGYYDPEKDRVRKR